MAEKRGELKCGVVRYLEAGTEGLDDEFVFLVFCGSVVICGVNPGLGWWGEAMVHRDVW